MFECKICEKKFKAFNFIITHIKNKHNGDLIEYTEKKVWSHGVIGSVHVRYDSNTYPKGVNIYYMMEGQPNRVLQSNIIEEGKEEEV
jgi:hypothetical protein